MIKLRSSQFRKSVGDSVFSDYIYTEKLRHKDHAVMGRRNSMRAVFLLLLLSIVILVLFGRAFFLQIIRGTYYRGLSDNNRIKTVVIHAPRGIIFDRNGVPLVYNVPGYRENPPAGGNGKTQFLSQETAIGLIAKGNKNLEMDTLRQYPYKDYFAHVLGYVGQISKEELGDNNLQSYQPSDVIGKTGIEQQYEKSLKGVDGKSLLEVDSLGQTIRVIGQQDPVPGKNITLTLDSALQKAAFEAGKDIRKGAIIVSSPKGEILALVSKPSFDPNLFTMGQGYKPDTSSPYQNVSSILLDDTNQPFLDRAISGTYPPGSTFKLIVASAGLENNIIDENFQVNDTGVLQVGSFSFSNWYYTQYGGTDGLVNIVKAIKRSNDIFFYLLSQKVGVDQISQMAKKFGLGDVLGIDLQGEMKGLVPTVEWKEKAMGEPWYLGDTYHYGIGQGYLLTTPLQVNAWTQALANNGVLYKPYLNYDLKPQILDNKFLSDNTVNLIREGMIESCSPGGVAWPLFDFKVKNPKLAIDGKNILEAPQATTSADFKDYRKITIACKTGTAQHGGENTMPHAWTTLFAPAYNPQIIVTVLSEESGEGSNVAAPIAKKILEEWFSR